MSTDPDMPTDERELFDRIHNLKAKRFTTTDANELIEIQHAVGELTQALVMLRRDKRQRDNHESNRPAVNAG